MSSIGTSKASIAAFFSLFVLAVSLPPKWATLHIAGLVLIAAVGFARRADWHSTAMRTFLLCTALWLVPVLLTASLQHALGIATAPDWLELPILVLRMLGIGMGIIILIQRGWLTLYSATFAVLCALSIHAGAGLIDLLTEPNASLTAWRQIRINGLVFNPNPFGMFMAITAILSAGLLRNQRSHRPALWALLLAALLCVWVSGSRGAILVVATGFVVLFPPAGRTRLFLYLGGAALAVGVYLFVGVQANVTHSDNARMQIILFTLEQILQAPWLGWGIGAYEHIPGHVVNAPHNMWLDLAISSGLVALAGGLLSAALLIVRLYRQSQPAAQLALAVFVATLVAGTLEYSILDSTHFRGVCVLVVALACCTLNERCGSLKKANRAASAGKMT